MAQSVFKSKAKQIQSCWEWKTFSLQIYNGNLIYDLKHSYLLSIKCLNIIWQGLIIFFNLLLFKRKFWLPEILIQCYENLSFSSGIIWPTSIVIAYMWPCLIYFTYVLLIHAYFNYNTYDIC